MALAEISQPRGTTLNAIPSLERMDATIGAIKTRFGEAPYPEAKYWQPTDFEVAALSQTYALGEVLAKDDIAKRNLISAISGDLKWNKLNKNGRAKAAINTLGEIAVFGESFLSQEGTENVTFSEQARRQAGKSLLKNLRHLNSVSAGQVSRLFENPAFFVDMDLQGLQEITEIAAHVATKLASSASNLHKIRENIKPSGSKNSNSRGVPPKLGIGLVLGTLALGALACITTETANDAGTAIAEVQEAANQGLAGLCQGVDASNNLACQPGVNPLNVGQPPSVDDAVAHIEQAYAAQGFNPEAAGSETARWWAKWGLELMRLGYIYNEQKGSLEYYDMSLDLPQSDQREALYELSQITGEEGRRLIIEIGPFHGVSPAQTASAFENTTVIAVDPHSGPPTTINFDTNTYYQGQLPEQKNNSSFAAFFNLNVLELTPERMGKKADQVHIFAPQTNNYSILTLQGCRLGSKVVMVPYIADLVANPGILQQTVDNLSGTGCNAEIVPMAVKDIIKLTGIKHSLALKDLNPEDIIDTIRATPSQ